MKRSLYIYSLIVAIGVLAGCGQQVPYETLGKVTETTEAAETTVEQAVIVSEVDESASTIECESIISAENVELFESTLPTTESKSEDAITDVDKIVESSESSMKESHMEELKQEVSVTNEIVQESIAESNENVTCIRITDGSNGNQVDVTDLETISEFIENLNAIEILTEEEATGVYQRVGYQYMLRFLDAQNNTIKKITVQGDYIVVDERSLKVNSTEDMVTYIAAFY